MNNAALRILTLIVLTVGIVLTFSYREHLDVAALEDRVADAGVVAPLLFMGMYALATVLFMPGSVLTLAGGGGLSAAAGRSSETPRHKRSSNEDFADTERPTLWY